MLVNAQLMQGIFQKENTDKALKYGIYRHLPTYEKIIRNLVSFYESKNISASLNEKSVCKEQTFLYHRVLLAFFTYANEKFLNTYETVSYYT
ncbi:hypothetical protein HMPREF0983_03960 [Erysipelotrichaceae bacterium 3_1_53]|nr:hypothetical protein HMPREF0983_03960 [Erysipelotrichaceae bacterium 3_1_53]